MGRDCRFSGGGGGVAGGKGGNVLGCGVVWCGVVWCGVSLSSHFLEPNHGCLDTIIHHISHITCQHHISSYHRFATKQADIERDLPVPCGTVPYGTVPHGTVRFRTVRNCDNFPPPELDPGSPG